MRSIIVLLLLVAVLHGLEIVQNLEVPQTHIGDQAIACHTDSAPKVTNGFATYFSDNVYACESWNHKAKSLTQCFVALNGVCGMHQSFCDHCVEVTNSDGQSEKCRVIDFCDPKNCDFLDPGHLDVLDNNSRANYKFLDKGKNVEPYKGAGGQPVITWKWTAC
jgi:hypothetical protein